MAGFMIAALFGSMTLGIPVAIAIALSSTLAIKFFSTLPLLVVAQQFFVSLDSFPLIAIPLFVLAGNLMEAGGVSTRLVNVAKALVGRGKGGLAATCIVTCLIFGAVSGSSIATTFAVGAILVPAMARQGYPVPFAAALQATSAEMAVIMPPSIPMILFGVSTGTSIGALFMAGVLPALMMACALIVLVYVWSYWRDWGAGATSEHTTFTASVRQGILALLMPVIIVGGIYGGVFTPSESAVVAVFYSLFIGMLVYRELTIEKIIQCLTKSAATTAFIMMTLGAAGLFTFIINRTGAPAAVAAWLGEVFQTQLTFLFAVNALLFVIGMFIETSAAILVLAPLLLPVAVSLGVDPVHFGLVMIVNLALGMMTPPIGVNLYAACAVAKVPIEKVAPSLIPFIVVVLMCLALLTYVPAITLWLPTILG